MNQSVNSQLRLDLLREALPYIQRFKGKTFVVKFSGKVTEDHERLISLCEELALLHQVGIRICVIHGGGKQLSDLAAKMGVEQTIIEGRRVTDDDTLEMAKMIFAGKINTDILAALRHRGVHAVGLSGVDANIVHAERRPPREITNRETGESAEVDFGHVGDILEIDSSLLTVLLDHGYLPVISSLGADDEGRSSTSTPTRLRQRLPFNCTRKSWCCYRMSMEFICVTEKPSRSFHASARPRPRP